MSDEQLRAAITDCEGFVRGVYREISKCTVELVCKALISRLDAEMRDASPSLATAIAEVTEREALAWLSSDEARALPDGVARQRVRERWGAGVEAALQRQFGQRHG